MDSQPADLRSVFSAHPGASALLLADAPIFTIVASTDEFADFAGTEKINLIGHSLFTYFPDNPDAPNVSDDIRASLTACINTKQKNELAVQRYDIATSNGTFDEMYWTIIHTPVLDPSGDIAYLIHTAIDVTERMLSQSKDDQIRLLQPAQNLLNQSTVAIHAFRGPELIVEMANEPTLKFWGKDASVIGKPFREVLPELIPQHFLELIQKVYTTGELYQAYEIPVDFDHADGKVTYYLNFVLQPFYEGGLKPAGVIAMANDVTKMYLEKKALSDNERLLEQVVQQTAQQLKSLIDNAPFPIAMYTGREMQIEMANQALLDVWGRDSSVIGDTYYNVLTELKDTGVFELLDKVYTSGEPFHASNAKIELLSEGQLKTFYFNYSFTPLFDTNGQVYGVMNTAADVTDVNVIQKALAESERNFRTMILLAPVAMTLMRGPSLVIEIANDSMIELWGKDKASVMNKPYFEALADTRNQGLEEILSNVYHTGNTFTALESPVSFLRHGQTETAYLNFVCEPYRDGDGNIVGVLGIAIEVTDQVLARHKIEEVVEERTKELADANQRLQSSNAELEQFAYIASHDLQEPLRKINMFAGLLENSLENPNERIRKHFTNIGISVQRMTNLIHDILSYSQLSRKQEVFRTTNLEEIFAETISDFDLIVDEKKGKVTHSELPSIEAIPLQMVQLFHNLISNALKYSRPDFSPRIHITAQTLTYDEQVELGLPTLESPYLKLVFADNGIGFLPEYESKIFHIFHRLHGKGQYEGTGIGLAMCKKIAENHNGIIFATGMEGIGATFTVVLPTKQA